MHNVWMAVWVLCEGVAAPGLLVMIGWLCERRRRTLIARGVSPSWGSWDTWRKDDWQRREPDRPVAELIGLVRRDLVGQLVLCLVAAGLWATFLWWVGWDEEAKGRNVVPLLLRMPPLSVVMATLMARRGLFPALRLSRVCAGGPPKRVMEEVGKVWHGTYGVSCSLMLLGLWPLNWIALTLWNTQLARICEGWGRSIGSVALAEAGGRAARSWRICFLASALLMVSLATMLFQSPSLLFPLLMAGQLLLFAVYATWQLSRALGIAAKEFGSGVTQVAGQSTGASSR